MEEFRQKIRKVMSRASLLCQQDSIKRSSSLKHSIHRVAPSRTASKMVKIAIAGPGELARYLLEEFIHQHDVVVFTRSNKDWISRLNVPQRITDYSVTNLVTQLHDCDVLISTVCMYDMENVRVHLNMLETCKRSPKCKKPIPSEWGGNTEDFTDQPAFYFGNHEPIRQALREQDEVQWTLVINGWFLEYMVPLKNRYFKSAGEIWPMNHEEKVITIYGKGTQPIDVTSARDVGKALIELFKHDHWEPYTYLAGAQSTWLDIYNTVKERDQAWQTKHVSLVQSIRKFVHSKTES